MIVPTMTPEEIFSEIQKDVYFLQEKTDELALKYSKLAKRATRFPHFHFYLLSSKKTMINYYVLCYAYRRGEWDHPHSIVYTEYAHEGGKTLVLLENEEFAIRIYTPHFFSRFKERELAIKKMFPYLMDSAPHATFLLRNKAVKEANVLQMMFETMGEKPEDYKDLFEHNSRFFQDEDYERIPMNCIDGLCLTERCKANPKINIYNTFVSYDQLKGSQQFDYMLNVPHLILEKMNYVYPNQRSTWEKEWNDMMAGLDESLGMEGWLRSIAQKLDEFGKRYPLPYIF